MVDSADYASCVIVGNVKREVVMGRICFRVIKIKWRNCPKCIKRNCQSHSLWSEDVLYLFIFFCCIFSQRLFRIKVRKKYSKAEIKNANQIPLNEPFYNCNFFIFQDSSFKCYPKVYYISLGGIERDYHTQAFQIVSYVYLIKFWMCYVSCLIVSIKGLEMLSHKNFESRQVFLILRNVIIDNFFFVSQFISHKPKPTRLELTSC